MPGTFNRRITTLDQRVGDTKLTGSVVVDQRYAKYQHERLDLRHPRGGKAKYLADPLYQLHRPILMMIGREVLSVGPVPPMIRGVEWISKEVGVQAPIDENDLRRSGNPRVFDELGSHYDRKPTRPRLSPQELRLKSARRRGWVA